MKKLIFILLVIMCMFSAVVQADISNESDELIVFVDRQLITHTVQIFMANPFGICSGVVIKKTNDLTYILTCKHCVSLNEEVYVEDKLVIGVICSAGDDLAILIVDGVLKDKVSVKLAPENAKKDDIIYLVGYPHMNEEIFVSKGTVLRYIDDWGLGKLLSIGGTSGGGIFNTKSELIGTNWGSFTKDSINLFEPVSDIKIFLNTYNLLW